MNFKDALRTFKFKKNIPGFHQLFTVWGENIDPEKLLSEYPRPQMKRDNYTILNGYWNYCIAAGALMPEQYDGRILVPFSPESVLSGVNRQLKPEELLWYERILTVDKLPKGKRCILHFGAVDQNCEVYINHRKAGSHIGGYLPFSIDITHMLEEGTNLLSLKVQDTTETSHHSRGKQKLNRGGMFYTAQSGIWQTVWLEWVPDLYISSLKLTPLVDASAVRVELTMNDDFNREKAEHINFRVEIYDKGRLLASMNSKMPFMTVALPQFTFWTPEKPYLYDLVISAGADKVISYFAMRKVEIKIDKDNIPRIYLNHEPYYQNGLLDQGYWPDGLYTAPSDEAMIYDIKKAKELGFNMLRKHIKIEPLRWYYHCDRIGMLVWQDMVNGGEDYNPWIVGNLPTIFPWLQSRIKDSHYSLFGRKSEEGRLEWIRECEETVAHLYNCPSIIVWVPFNEAWGQFDATKAYQRIHDMDPNRLIDHASGWYDQQCGDFKSIHNYFHPFRVKSEQRPYILSEFGGYACYTPDHSFSMQIYGYRIYLTREELDLAYQALMKKEISVLIKEGLSASVYTQLTDVEDEVNGLLTYDRKICKVSPVTMHFRE